MPKYRVQFARTTWLTAFVEAEDEEQALELAWDELPGFSAVESGWGSFGKWTADADEWMPVDEFIGSDYSEDRHGPVVEEDDQ